MTAVDSLEKIRKNWLLKVSHRLARGEGVRAIIEKQLIRFFDLLEQAVSSGDPDWLHPMLDLWAETRTESDLKSNESSLAAVLNLILLQTFEVARASLDEAETVELIGAVLPVYTHAFTYTAGKEAQLQVDRVSRELENSRAAMEKLDKSKSDFIAIAAHELKTPLTLIDGYMAMLREHLPGEDEDQTVEVLLKGVKNGTRRLQEIVDDIIDVSMIDNNILALNFQPIWINRILRVIEHEFSDTVQQRRLKMQIKDFPGSNEMTFGDDERLYQAFRNVIANAIKYTPDGGSITVDGHKLPGFVEITVSDTGIGVAPEFHNRIFEKFGRIGSVSLHSSGKTKFKGGGPGLGLPITRGIIEAHGGAIWVYSEGYDEEKCPGTTFHILLPMRKEPPDEKFAKLFQPLIAMNNHGENPVEYNQDDGVNIKGAD